MAHGKYIALLDSDDIWMKNKLALQIACMENKPDIAFCCTNFYDFDDEGIIKGQNQESWEAYKIYGLTLDNIFPKKQPLSDIVRYDLQNQQNTDFYSGRIFEKFLWGPLLNESSPLLKKEIALETIPHMEGFNYLHGYYLFTFISMYHPVGFIDLPLCGRRCNIEEKEGQAAQLTTAKHQIGIRKEYLKLIEFFWKNEKNFYSKYKKDVDGRLSYINADLAAYYLQQNYPLESVKHYMSSLRLCPTHKRLYYNLLCAVLTFIFKNKR